MEVKAGFREDTDVGRGEGTSFFRKWVQKCIGLVTRGYLRLVELTSAFEIRNFDRLQSGRIAGYWHEDSTIMQLVLRRIVQSGVNVKVIVTADRRGDYIEEVISRFGGEALRLPDSLKIIPFYKELKEESKKGGFLLACSFDGPLGPRRQPKKLSFSLACGAEKEMVMLRVAYSKALRLAKRWDKYAIPLPFTAIRVEVEPLGRVSKEELRRFPDIIYEKYDFFGKHSV